MMEEFIRKFPCVMEEGGRIHPCVVVEIVRPGQRVIKYWIDLRESTGIPHCQTTEEAMAIARRVKIDGLESNDDPIWSLEGE